MPPADDIDRLMAIMAVSFDPNFGEAWTRRQVEDALVIGNCHYHLIGPGKGDLAPGDPAAGFFLSRAGFDEEELLLFAVDPAWRRQGIGRRPGSAAPGGFCWKCGVAIRPKHCTAASASHRSENVETITARKTAKQSTR
jgi:GNAT superfamily N-acetyltransferase